MGLFQSATENLKVYISRLERDDNIAFKRYDTHPSATHPSYIHEMSTATRPDAEETSRDSGAMGDDEGLGALNENGDDVNVSHSAPSSIGGWFGTVQTSPRASDESTSSFSSEVDDSSFLTEDQSSIFDESLSSVFDEAEGEEDESGMLVGLGISTKSGKGLKSTGLISQAHRDPYRAAYGADEESPSEVFREEILQTVESM
jgi:hypothetical protein